MGEFPKLVNKDLADVLGNFVSRITKFCRSKFGEAVPEAGSYGAAEKALIADITARWRATRTYGRHGSAQSRRRTARHLGGGQ